MTKQLISRHATNLIIETKKNHNFYLGMIDCFVTNDIVKLHKQLNNFLLVLLSFKQGSQQQQIIVVGVTSVGSSGAKQKINAVKVEQSYRHWNTLCTYVLCAYLVRDVIEIYFQYIIF